MAQYCCFIYHHLSFPASFNCNMFVYFNIKLKILSHSMDISSITGFGIVMNIALHSLSGSMKRCVAVSIDRIAGSALCYMDTNISVGLIFHVRTQKNMIPLCRVERSVEPVQRLCFCPPTLQARGVSYSGRSQRAIQQSFLPLNRSDV